MIKLSFSSLFVMATTAPWDHQVGQPHSLKYSSAAMGLAGTDLPSPCPLVWQVELHRVLVSPLHRLQHSVGTRSGAQKIPSAASAACQRLKPL